jgi:biotin carboxylase
MNKTVFIIETNFVGNGCQVMRFARERGLGVHFLSNDPSVYVGRTSPLPQELADETTVIDCYDASKLLHFFSARRDEAAAVLAFTDFHAIYSAIVNAYLGLPGPSVEAIVNCRNKWLTRRLTNALSVAVRCVPVQLNDWPSASPVGYPCVVKPSDESGSVGVSVCQSDKDFAGARERIVALPTNVRNYHRTGTILIEEFINGQEYSAEMYWDSSGETWRCFGFTRKQLFHGNGCVEQAHTFPHHLATAPDTVARWLAKCLEALGLRHTIAHVEFKIDERGNAALIEVNPRIAGDNIADLVAMATGTDPLEALLEIALGRPISPAILKSGWFGTVMFLGPEQTGTVASIELRQPSPPGLVKAVFRNRVPFAYPGPISSSFRLGYVICSGASEADSIDQATEALSRVQVRYQ